ncbi:MAG: hypothetical protein H6779_01030 [Candidatus Nomurabacteria bacterium]|nr:hypothetical protein [Candidatus Nomurabacteria bacterium]USN88013.1 MAG: hypothetical protein H6779_01030 [Candidatus Nomurabacteria bacterium]
MKKINKIILMAMAVVLVPTVSLAATIQAGEEVSIKKGVEVNDNLYVAGGNVTLAADIAGDLFAAGGNVLVTGKVSDDIALVGGSVTVLGDVGGDVRVAGGNILLTGDVGGELIVMGGSVLVSSDVTVNKDLILVGGQVTLDGNVLGNVRINGGVATINGQVSGKVEAEVTDSLTLGETAVINSGLGYAGRSENILKKDEAAVVEGETVFKMVERPQKPDAENVIAALLGALFVFKLITTIVAALILVWLFRRFSETVVQDAIADPLAKLGKGFVAVVIVPVVIVLLFVTIFGLPLGILTILAYILLLMLSGIYAGVLAGVWLLKLIGNGQITITWFKVVIGVLLLTLVSLIPIVGWIITFLVFLITVGTIVNVMQKKFWLER